MKTFYLCLLILLFASCISKGDQKIALLDKELKTVPILSSVFDSLLNEVNALSPEQRFRILYNISSREEADCGVIEKQEKLLLEALTITSKKEKKKVLQKLVFLYQKLDQLGFLNATSKGVNRCVELETQYTLTDKERWDLKNKKAIFFNRQGLYKESISMLYDLLDEHRDTEDMVSVIHDLYEIATYFVRLGDLEKGLALFNEAYSHAVERKLLEQQAFCLSSIIGVSFNMGRYNDVIDICQTLNFDSITKYISFPYNVLAECYLQLQKPDSARFYLAQMNLKQQRNSRMVFYCRMAETFISENREDSTAYYMNKAINSINAVNGVKRNGNVPLYFMYVYPSYASLLQKNGKVEQASEAFQFVEPLMRTPVSEPERMEKQIDALGRYSDFCRFTKRYAKAAELLVYRDSIQKLYYENKISLDSKHWVDRFEIQELTYTTDKQRDEINNAKRMLAIIIAASVIVLCISAIAFYLYVKYRKQNKELRELKMQEIQAVQLANSQTNLPKKREPLTPQEKLYNAAKKLVESQKLFLNDALTLDELAEKLDTNRSTLSACINQCSKSNFNQWINNYRIDFIQKRITATSNSRELYTGSGFKSYNTFNNSFKERLGCTPSEYIKEHKYDNLPKDENPIA